MCHLAKSLATVSLGHVTKVAECVPEMYVSDAMENALKPTVLSSWNINTLRSTVWGGAKAEEEENEPQPTTGFSRVQNTSTNKSKYNECGVLETSTCSVEHQWKKHAHHNQSFRGSTSQCLCTGQSNAHILSQHTVYTQSLLPRNRLRTANMHSVLLILTLFNGISPTSHCRYTGRNVNMPWITLHCCAQCCSTGIMYARAQLFSLPYFIR